MPAVAVVAVAGIASAAMQARAASDAASTQANAMNRAAAISAASAAKAREEILTRMVPALDTYAQGIAGAQTQIANGATDVMRILQTTTGAADQMLQSVGADARQALLGSAAATQGIPRAQFEQQFNQMPTAPTAQGAPTGAADLMRGRPPGLEGKTYEQTLAGLAGTPELTRDQAGTLMTVDQARQEAQAATGGAALPTRGGPLPTMGAVATGPATMAPTTTGTPSGIGFAGAQSQLQQGEDIGARALQQSTAQARQDVLTGQQAGLQSIAQGRESAVAGFQPYAQAGAGAIQQEAALSGALGPEAQQAAINSFIESPGQRYLREQQEKALVRQGAATGGLGGGRIRSALMEQAMGIAATQQQQQLENLRSIATRGQDVAGSLANINMGAGTSAAGIQTGSAQQLANLAQSLGMNISQLMSLSSQQKAALAERTGINLSQLEQAIGAARVAGVQGLGTSLAGVVGSTAGDLASLQERQATTTLNAQQNLSSTLGNLAVGAGNQAAAYTAGAGTALGSGQYLAGNAWAQGLQGLGNVAAYGIASQPTTPTMTANQKLSLGIY